MKKILASILTLALVVGATVVATNAFFSDTETSTGNTFVAGNLDLQVDSTAHYAGLTCTEGVWVEDVTDQSSRPDLIGDPCDGTWPAQDLTSEKFFNLSDIKPGDFGEDTISLHANSNDQYVCAAIYNLDNAENTVEPTETSDGDTGGPDGELASQVNFFAWADDGDNVWETGEAPLFSNVFGPASDVLNGVVYPLFTPNTVQLAEGDTENVGLYWCYGALTVDQNTHTLTCDGSNVDNTGQTDSLTADMSFFAEQSRNNADFTCPDITTFQ
jgi:SipW-cognate class signal peptide